MMKKNCAKSNILLAAFLPSSTWTCARTACYKFVSKLTYIVKRTDSQARIWKPLSGKNYLSPYHASREKIYSEKADQYLVAEFLETLNELNARRRKIFKDRNCECIDKTRKLTFQIARWLEWARVKIYIFSLLIFDDFS